MTGNEINVFEFYYHSSYKDKNNNPTEILVDYKSNTEICNKQFRKLYDKGKNCLDADKDDDIVKVVHKLRKLFDNIEEYKMDITIRNNDSIQHVICIDGNLDYCCFSFKKWDDIVEVCSNYKGTEIQYKKYGKHVYTKKDVDSIYSEINVFTKKIVKLREMDSNLKVLKREMIGGLYGRNI